MPVDSTADLDAIRDALAHVIRGKRDVIETLLVGVLAGGHVLLEDVPGTGKTTLTKALAHTFDVGFTRVQFTPDLLPADIVGSQLLDPSAGTFSFRPGPVFGHILLADEINRASPRTQSALLEAMSEGQVTVDGTTYPLPRPFFVLATQNPVDYQGTYPLPEAQLDRFILRFGIGYPPADEEIEVLFAQQRVHPLDSLKPVATIERLLEMQGEVRGVEVSREVAAYLHALAEATRHHDDLDLGVSTRGLLAFFRGCQARAYLQGRSYVIPDDAQAIAVPVLAHRILLGQEAKYGGTTPDIIVKSIIDSVPVPT